MKATDIKYIADSLYKCFGIYVYNFDYDSFSYDNKHHKENDEYKMRIGNYANQTFHHYRDNCWKQFIQQMKEKYQDCDVKKYPKSKGYIWSWSESYVIKIGNIKVKFYQQQGYPKCQAEYRNTNYITTNSSELYDLISQKAKVYNDTVINDLKIKNLKNHIKYEETILESSKRELARLITEEIKKD